MSVAPPDTTPVESIDDRERRALLEALLVERDTEDLYRVYGESGEEYVVDTRNGACTCPDFQYRATECKHLRRARLEAGEYDTDDLTDRIDRELDAVDDRIADLAARRATLVRLKAALGRFE